MRKKREWNEEGSKSKPKCWALEDKCKSKRWTNGGTLPKPSSTTKERKWIGGNPMGKQSYLVGTVGSGFSRRSLMSQGRKSIVNMSGFSFLNHWTVLTWYRNCDVQHFATPHALSSLFGGRNSFQFTEMLGVHGKLRCVVILWACRMCLMEWMKVFGVYEEK